MARTQGSVHLVRGEDRVIGLSIRKKGEMPLDLTGVSAIIATFKTRDQNLASVSLAGQEIEVVSPAGAGVINITLNSTFTANLSDGDRQDFQVDLILGGKKMSFRFEEALNVAESMTAV